MTDLDNDDLNAARGVIYGMLISIVAWGLIVWAVMR